MVLAIVAYRTCIEPDKSRIKIQDLAARGTMFSLLAPHAFLYSVQITLYLFFSLWFLLISLLSRTRSVRTQAP